MLFLSLIIALALVQFWGSGAPLHRDQWFYRLVRRLQSWPLLANAAGGVLFVALFLPLLALALILGVADRVAAVVELGVFVAVLLFSFGRGNFSASLNDYLIAWSHRDSARACQVLIELSDSERALEPIDRWEELHTHALRLFAYRGFERLFAVLFWFLLLGPAGALLYRLSWLYVQALTEDQADSALARYWLWLLEWPAVRVLGLSWAVAGNFVGCIQAWNECLLCRQRTTAEVLQHYLSGALGVVQQEAGVVAVETAAEIEALQSLLSRTLIVWLSILAIFAILL